MKLLAHMLFPLSACMVELEQKRSDKVSLVPSATDSGQEQGRKIEY